MSVLMGEQNGEFDIKKAHTALVFCLERCRAIIEHRDETPEWCLDAAMSEAIRTLEVYGGPIRQEPDYWKQVVAFRAPGEDPYENEREASD